MSSSELQHSHEEVAITAASHTETKSSSADSITAVEVVSHTISDVASSTASLKSSLDAHQPDGIASNDSGVPTSSSAAVHAKSPTLPPRSSKPGARPPVPSRDALNRKESTITSADKRAALLDEQVTRALTSLRQAVATLAEAARSDVELAALCGEALATLENSVMSDEVVGNIERAVNQRETFRAHGCSSSAAGFFAFLSDDLIRVLLSYLNVVEATRLCSCCKQLWSLRPPKPDLSSLKKDSASDMKNIASSPRDESVVGEGSPTTPHAASSSKQKKAKKTSEASPVSSPSSVATTSTSHSSTTKPSKSSRRSASGASSNSKRGKSLSGSKGKDSTDGSPGSTATSLGNSSSSNLPMQPAVTNSPSTSHSRKKSSASDHPVAATTPVASGAPAMGSTDISEERPACPNGLDCTSSDPEHFMHFTHTPDRAIPKREQWFLAEWIKSVNLPDDYVNVLASDGFDDLNALVMVTDADLKRAGIEKAGHRKQILFHVKDLRAKLGALEPAVRHYDIKAILDDDEGKDKGAKGAAATGRSGAPATGAAAPSSARGRPRRESFDIEEFDELQKPAKGKDKSVKKKAKEDKPSKNAGPLDYSRRQLVELPAEICKRTDVQILNLYMNKLETLPAEMGRMVSLTALGLNENNLKSLPVELANLKHLRVLDLRSNKLQELPGVILKGMPSLNKLFLRHNRLTALPPEIASLKELEVLSVRFNHLTGSMPPLDALVNLKVLDLCGNKISEFPSIRTLSRLNVLDLKQNQLTTLIDDSWSSLLELSRVDLALNQLTVFSPCLLDLVELEALDMESNQIKTLPSGIGRLAKLQQLHLSHNRIDGLPDEIGELSSLRLFVLKGNKLTSVPESFRNLTQLKQLDLSTNEFEEFPRSILLPSLLSLVISDNQLVMLPDELGGMVALKMLDVEANCLEELPPSIGGLVALREIKLGCNELHELADELGDLSDLQHLWAEHNHLEYVPQSFGNLQSLCKLVLSDNELDDLPNELVFLDNLTELKVDSNPMRMIPDAQRGGNAAFHFLIKRAAAERGN